MIFTRNKRTLITHISIRMKLITFMRIISKWYYPKMEYKNVKFNSRINEKLTGNSDITNNLVN